MVRPGRGAVRAHPDHVAIAASAARIGAGTGTGTGAGAGAGADAGAAAGKPDHSSALMVPAGSVFQRTMKAIAKNSSACANSDSAKAGAVPFSGACQ